MILHITRECKLKFSTRKMILKYSTLKVKTLIDHQLNTNILNKRFFNITILKPMDPTLQPKYLHLGEEQYLLKLRQLLAASRGQDSKFLNKLMPT
jgi:hypothetical protein